MLPIYQPYFEEARAEREKFAQEFDIEKLYRESKQLAMTSLDTLVWKTPHSSCSVHGAFGLLIMAMNNLTI